MCHRGARSSGWWNRSAYGCECDGSGLEDPMCIPLLGNFQESGRWRDLIYSGSEEPLED